MAPDTRPPGDGFADERDARVAQARLTPAQQPRPHHDQHDDPAKEGERPWREEVGHGIRPNQSKLPSPPSASSPRPAPAEPEHRAARRGPPARGPPRRGTR